MQHLRHPRVTIGPARLLSDLLEDAWPLHRYAARCTSVHQLPTAAPSRCRARQAAARWSSGSASRTSSAGDPYDPRVPGSSPGGSTGTNRTQPTAARPRRRAHLAGGSCIGTKRVRSLTCAIWPVRRRSRPPCRSVRCSPARQAPVVLVEAVHPWCVTGVEDPAGTWATLPVRHWRRRRDAASPGVVPLPLIGWRGLRSRSE